MKECGKNSCDVNAKCKNTIESHICTCNNGFTGNGKKCKDINECLNKPCSTLVKCTNTYGSYTCGACPNGYTGNGAICIGMISLSVLSYISFQIYITFRGKNLYQARKYIEFPIS